MYLDLYIYFMFEVIKRKEATKLLGSYIENKFVVMKREKEGGRDELGVWD